MSPVACVFVRSLNISIPVAELIIFPHCPPHSVDVPPLHSSESLRMLSFMSKAMGVIHHISFLLVSYNQSQTKISCMITFKYLLNPLISLHCPCSCLDLGRPYPFTDLKLLKKNCLPVIMSNCHLVPSASRARTIP